MRKGGILLVCTLLFGLAQAARAQNEALTEPRTEIFLGYSYLRTVPASLKMGRFNEHGGSASFAYYGRNWLGIVADFGFYNVLTTLGGKEYTYLFGPRFVLNRGGEISAFGEVLFGGARVDNTVYSTPGGPQGSFALASGGGFDFRISQHLSARLGPVEYLKTGFQEDSIGSQTQHAFRFSSGIVFRF